MFKELPLQIINLYYDFIIGLSIMTPTIIVIIFFITSLHKKGPDCLCSTQMAMIS